MPIQMKPFPNKSQTASDFFDKTADTLVNLKGRWMDEKEYEDINDYVKPFEETAKQMGVTLVGMTKRPFGLKYSCDGRTFHMNIKGNSIGYVRIA